MYLYYNNHFEAIHTYCERFECILYIVIACMYVWKRCMRSSVLPKINMLYESSLKISFYIWEEKEIHLLLILFKNSSAYIIENRPSQEQWDYLHIHGLSTWNETVNSHPLSTHSVPYVCLFQVQIFLLWLCVFFFFGNAWVLIHRMTSCISNWSDFGGSEGYQSH